jgi:hypothetical protein
VTSTLVLCSSSRLFGGTAIGFVLTALLVRENMYCTCVRPDNLMQCVFYGHTNQSSVGLDDCTFNPVLLRYAYVFDSL